MNKNGDLNHVNENIKKEKKILINAIIRLRYKVTQSTLSIYGVSIIIC